MTPFIDTTKSTLSRRLPWVEIIDSDTGAVLAMVFARAANGLYDNAQLEAVRRAFEPVGTGPAPLDDEPTVNVPAFLNKLADKLMRLPPAAIGTDQGDVVELKTIAAKVGQIDAGLRHLEAVIGSRNVEIVGHPGDLRAGLLAVIRLIRGGLSA